MRAVNELKKQVVFESVGSQEPTGGPDSNRPSGHGPGEAKAEKKTSRGVNARATVVPRIPFT